MTEEAKKILAIVGAVIAVGIAVFVGMKSMGGAGVPKENVVGTIDMGAGGGREAEGGPPAGGTPGTPPLATDPNAAADPSGMPVDMVDGVKDGR